LGDGKDNPAQVAGDGSQGLIFRDNSGGTYFNSIFGDFKGQPNAPALTIEDVADAASEDSRKRLEVGDLKLLNNFWFDFSAGTTLEALVPQDFVRSSPNFADNQITDPALRGIGRTVDGMLDPRLEFNSLAVNAADNDLYTDSWFTKVGYVGAFSSNSNWLKGWTALDALGYLSDSKLVNNESETKFDIPSNIALDQNYPNPFNPSTNITFTLPSTQRVTLKVYNMLGQEVATLINNQTIQAGSRTVAFDASLLSSGVYIYRLIGANTILTKKMTLIK
ncbi:MAG: T9SS type A sorting domain-containing protein, partial [Balneolaceae bacterium]